MGKIMDEYLEIVKKYKEVIPDEVYDTILSNQSATPSESLKPDLGDKEKYFIEGYDELSQAVFDFLHSGRGPYVMGYVSEFNINRLSAGFQCVEELVHFAIWIIERHYKNNTLRSEDWSKLKEKDITKTKKEILENVVANGQIEKELRELTFNMKNADDFSKRLTLIKLLEEKKCLAYDLLGSLPYYKQLDRIYSSLNLIDNVNELYKVPKPIYQSEWDLRRV